MLIIRKRFEGFLLEIDFENRNFEEAEINFDFDELSILLNSPALSIVQKNLLIKENQEKLINAPEEILNTIIYILNETPSPKPKINGDLLESLLQNGASQEEMIQVYISQISYLEPDNQRKFLSQLGPEYHEITVTKSNTTIPDDPYNLSLVRALQKAELISSFSQKESLLGAKVLKINAKRRR